MSACMSFDETLLDCKLDFPRLRHVDISYTDPLSVQTIVNMASQFTALKHLDCSYCTELSSRDIAMICEAVPNLESLRACPCNRGEGNIELWSSVILRYQTVVFCEELICIVLPSLRPSCSNMDPESLTLMDDLWHKGIL